MPEGVAVLRFDSPRKGHLYFEGRSVIEACFDFLNSPRFIVELLPGWVLKYNHRTASHDLIRSLSPPQITTIHFIADDSMEQAEIDSLLAAFPKAKKANK